MVLHRLARLRAPLLVMSLRAPNSLLVSALSDNLYSRPCLCLSSFDGFCISVILSDDIEASLVSLRFLGITLVAAKAAR